MSSFVKPIRKTIDFRNALYSMITRKLDIFYGRELLWISSPKILVYPV